MKKLILSLVISSFFLTSCGLIESGVYKKNEISATGDMVSKEYDFDSSSLVVKYMSIIREGNTYYPEVHLYQSEEKKTVVTMQESLFDKITIKQDENDGKLKIYGKPMDNYYTNKITIDLYGYSFSYVSLEQVNLTAEENTLSSDNLEFICKNKSNVTVDKIDCSSFTLTEDDNTVMNIKSLKAKGMTATVSANSDLTFDADLETLTLTQTGSSNIYPTGYVTSMVAIITSTSAFRGASFCINSVTLTESGASDVTINFFTTLKGSVSGASTLTFYGEKSAVEVTCDELSEVVDVVEN